MKIRTVTMLLSLLGLATPVGAQFMTQPQIGIDRATNPNGPWQIFERGLGTNQVPIGSIDPVNRTYAPLVTQVFGLSGPMSLDLTFAGTLNPNAVRFGPGNSISICPNLSCIYGINNGATQIPDATYQDHQRSSLLISGVTQDDLHSEEQTLAVTTTINKGAKKRWTANTSYQFGDNVVVGNAAYRVVQAGTTGTTDPLPSTRPTTPGLGNATTFTDNSVVWKWINDGAIGAKLSAYIETSVKQGAGFSEGLTTNFFLFPSYDATQGAWGQEEDCTNASGTDGAIGINVNCHVVAIGGANKWLHGFDLNGNKDGSLHSLWGFRASGGLATACAICVDDNANPTGAPLGATYGIQVGSLIGEAVSHSGADYYDNASSPNGFLDQGAHSFAAMSLGGSGGAAINDTGSYAFFLIAPGVSLTPDGILAVKTSKVLPVLVAALPTCSSTTEGTFGAVTDANATTYNSVAAGGGVNHMPVYCNGTNWTLH